MSKEAKVRNPVYNKKKDTPYIYICGKSSSYFVHACSSSYRFLAAPEIDYWNFSNMGFRICLKTIK